MEKKRRFRIPPQEEMEADKIAYKEKSQGNKLKGLKAFETGEVRLFHGFNPETLRQEYNFLFELTPESQRIIHERVVDPLRGIATKHGVQAIYPDTGDLPPHITLQLAYFKNIPEDQQATIIDELNESALLNWIACILKNVDISFDDLVTSDGSTYLGVTNYNEDDIPLTKARKLIGQIYNRTVSRSLPPSEGEIVSVNYQDIIHSTVSRITQAPHEQGKLISYYEEVQNLLVPLIQENPIPVAVGDVYRGRSYEFHVAHNSPIST